VGLVFTLALRNLRRHARRTLLTAVALAFGIALMVLGRAWTAAMEQAVVLPAKDAALGHVQVYARDAAAEAGGSISIVVPHNNYRLIREPRALLRTILAEEPRLAAGLARLAVGALLSSGDKSMEVMLLGIDPSERARVYPRLELRAGRFFEAGERGVLLNPGVARRLGASLGDTLVALGTTNDGRLGAVRLKFTGLWRVRGLEAYEWGACYADLAAMQELLDVGEAAGVLILRQRDPHAPSAPIVAALRERWRQQALPYEGYSWEEVGGPFIGSVVLTRFVTRFTDLIMALIVAAGVTNTTLMAVFERTREIGTLRAMGARRARVLALFLSEATLLGLGGALAGGLGGALLVAWLGHVGIPAFSEAQRYSYGGERLFPLVNWSDVLCVPAVMLIVCMLAALGPAALAARQRPADALRHV
jgi:putative ABC transport system permease protein